jgi:hypothetical protein
MFADRSVSQTETFFLVAKHSGILGPQVEELHRAEGIAEVRWWSIDEIRSSAEAIFPVDLAKRLKEHQENPT